MKKDEIQENIINQILQSGFLGIVESSVRSGKTRILLKSIQKYSVNYIKNPNILVLYPNIDIRKSWETECDLIDYHPNITYCTFVSIEKVYLKNWDYVIVDECHLIGTENQLPLLGELVKRHSNVILASGTINNNTLHELQLFTGLKKIVSYTTDMAIQDGIVCDYNVIIYEYSLDAVTSVEYGKTKKWKSTELKECNRLSYKVDSTYGKEKMFHALNRMRFINSCNSLVNSVRKWINQNKEKRFILFSGDENIGKKYGIPMYNSKSADDSVLLSFQRGEINQLCLIRKGRQGVTFPELRHILITAIDSNSENLEQALGRALLNDTENAIIHIFVSNQPFQKKWLNSALININPEKITWQNLNQNPLIE